jgi:hypothetical protein
LLTAREFTLRVREVDLEVRPGKPPKTPENFFVPSSTGKKPNHVE